MIATPSATTNTATVKSSSERVLAIRSMTRDTNRVPTTQTKAANTAAFPNARRSGLANDEALVAPVASTGRTTNATTVIRS